MTDIFLKFVNMGIAAGWLVPVVVLLRLVLRRAPKELMLVLWGIVALRLLLPVSIQSIFSLIPSAETISPLIGDMQKPQIHSGITVLNSAVNPVITQVFAPSPEASVNPVQVFIFAAAVCWIAGAAVMLLYAVISYWRLCRRIRTAVLSLSALPGRHMSAYTRVNMSFHLLCWESCVHAFICHFVSRKKIWNMSLHMSRRISDTMTTGGNSSASGCFHCTGITR